jgi:hypothetical protein
MKNNISIMEARTSGSDCGSNGFLDGFQEKLSKLNTHK